MTTLLIPSFERPTLQTLRNGLAAKPLSEWPQHSLQLCLDGLRTLRQSASQMREALEDELAEGVEAHSFTRSYGPFLPTAEEHVEFVRDLVKGLSAAQDPASKSVAAELRLLEDENKAFRDLLAEALSRASEPVRPADPARVRAAEEAHTRGETKPFARR
jgi:hypothetical protein